MSMLLMGAGKGGSGAPPTPPPENTVAPVVSMQDGSPQAYYGLVAQVTNGTWTNSPTSYSYQWYYNESPISGATSATYTLTQNAASSLRCEVTASNAGGASSPETSNDLTTNRTLVFNGSTPNDWTEVSNWDLLGGGSAASTPTTNDRVIFMDAGMTASGPEVFLDMISVSGQAVDTTDKDCREMRLMNECQQYGDSLVTQRLSVTDNAILNGNITFTGTVFFNNQAQLTGSIQIDTGGGNINFEQSSVNNGTISGGYVEFNQSINNNTIYGTEIIIGNSSSSAGYISGPCTFTGGSINSGQIIGNPSFVDSYTTTGSMITGNPSFSGFAASYDGSVTGDVTMNYPAQYPYSGAVSGVVNYVGYVFGCTDPGANNYDPSANTNDGSCSY